jgi:spore germination cell wall hydrolase CwlJ-like protein
MTNSSLSIALAITMACAGCAGLKKAVESISPANVAAQAAADAKMPGSIPATAKPKVLSTIHMDPDPKVVQTAAALRVAQAQENCLALNIYYEAGVENDIGKMAIANVTINRLQTGRWGKNICDVVYADSQFSWTAASNRPKPTGPSWEESRQAARHIIEGKRIESLETALYYHASYVKPYWKKSAAKIRQIGKHIFYSGARVAKPGEGIKVAQIAAAK